MRAWEAIKCWVRAAIWPPLIAMAIAGGYNVWNFFSGGLKQPSLPVIMFVQVDSPIEGMLAAVEAADDWNQTIGKEVIKISFTNLPCVHGRFCSRNGRNDLVFTNHQDATMSFRELAHTTVDPSLLSPGKLGETDVVVPDFIRSFSLLEKTYSFDEVDKYYLRRVLAHEFGHVLGLKHYLWPDGLMRPYEDGTFWDHVAAGTLETACKPNKLEIELIKQKYQEYFNGGREKTGKK